VAGGRSSTWVLGGAGSWSLWQAQRNAVKSDSKRRCFMCGVVF